MQAYALNGPIARGISEAARRGEADAGPHTGPKCVPHEPRTFHTASWVTLGPGIFEVCRSGAELSCWRLQQPQAIYKPKWDNARLPLASTRARAERHQPPRDLHDARFSFGN
jgi:hypothetical protein